MGGVICKAKLCDVCSTPSMKLRFLRILLCVVCIRRSLIQDLIKVSGFLLCHTTTMVVSNFTGCACTMHSDWGAVLTMYGVFIIVNEWHMLVSFTTSLIANHTQLEGAIQYTIPDMISDSIMLLACHQDIGLIVKFPTCMSPVMGFLASQVANLPGTHQAKANAYPATAQTSSLCAVTVCLHEMVA